MNRTGRVHGPFKRVKIAKQSAEIRREPPPMPGNGPYRVIVADPPWPFEIRDEDPSHRAKYPYPTMSIAQIAALRVGDLAHDNCVLWLWTTNFNMREALGLVENWGFQHKTLLTWVKDRFGYGDWLRTQTEHVIFATRGRPIVLLTNEFDRTLRADAHTFRKTRRVLCTRGKALPGAALLRAILPTQTPELGWSR